MCIYFLPPSLRSKGFMQKENNYQSPVIFLRCFVLHSELSDMKKKLFPSAAQTQNYFAMMPFFSFCNFFFYAVRFCYLYAQRSTLCSSRRRNGWGVQNKFEFMQLSSYLLSIKKTFYAFETCQKLFLRRAKKYTLT